jgi:hypothetical protein
MVDSKIALQIQRQVTDRLFSVRGRLVEKDVEVLQIVSRSLRKALHTEICRPTLVKHPLFCTWDRTDSVWLEEFCGSAVEMLFARQRDDIFNAGEEGKAAYYLTSGSVDYMQYPRSSPVAAATKTRMNNNMFLAEAVLWSKWIHVGTAEAGAPCSLLAIYPDAMWKVLKSQGIIRCGGTTLEPNRTASSRHAGIHQTQVGWTRGPGPCRKAVGRVGWSGLIKSNSGWFLGSLLVSGRSRWSTALAFTCVLPKQNLPCQSGRRTLVCQARNLASWFGRCLTKPSDISA